MIFTFIQCHLTLKFIWPIKWWASHFLQFSASIPYAYDSNPERLPDSKIDQHQIDLQGCIVFDLKVCPTSFDQCVRSSRLYRVRSEGFFGINFDLYQIDFDFDMASSFYFYFVWTDFVRIAHSSAQKSFVTAQFLNVTPRVSFLVI